MFGGGISAIGAISSFANSGSNNMASAINNGFANSLSNNKPPVLNGTNIANSISSGFNNSGSNTNGSGSFVGQMKNLVDAAYTIVNRIETTNILLQKLIDINSGKIQQNDINKIAAVNNRISIAMSRTAMGRLAMAVMAKQLGKNLGTMDYRMKGAIESGVTSNKEILTAKLLGNLPLIGKMFTSMKDISEKVLRAKDVFTNETNIAITKIIPDRLEAIGTYTRDIRDFIKKDLLRELMLQTQALVNIDNSVNKGFNRLSGSNTNAPNTPQLIIPGQSALVKAIESTNSAIDIMRNDISNALETSLEQDREINLARLKTDSQLRKAAAEQIEIQNKELELSIKLNRTSDQILKANVDTKTLLGGMVTRLPNILSRVINSALKVSLMMGIGRTIFRAFGANSIADNMTAQGAVGFMAASGRFIKSILDRMMNSKIGKSITSFIDKQVEFIKARMVDAFKYATTQAIRIYSTFVLLPKMFREHMAPAIGKAFAASKRFMVKHLTAFGGFLNQHLMSWTARWKQFATEEMEMHNTGIRSVITKSFMKVTGGIGKAFGFVASNIGKIISVAGIGLMIVNAVKDVVGTMFSAWKLTKSESELSSMTISQQVYEFTKSIFNTLTGAVTGSVKFLWNNLGPIISGFVSALLDWIYDNTIGAIKRWWNGTSERDALIAEAIEVQNQQNQEVQKSTAEAIQSSSEAAAKNTDSLKNALIENLKTINKAIVDGFKYVVKIFDLFKPKTLGGMAGNLVGGISEVIKIFMSDESRATFDKSQLESAKKGYNTINAKVLEVDPSLKDNVIFDQIGRPIGGNVDGYYAALKKLGVKAEFMESFLDQRAYSAEGRFGEQFKEKTQESFSNVLNDKEIRVNQLLDEIKENTYLTAQFTGTAVGVTKNQRDFASGKEFDVFRNREIWGTKDPIANALRLAITNKDVVPKEDMSAAFQGIFDEQLKGKIYGFDKTKPGKMIMGQMVGESPVALDLMGVYENTFDKKGITTKQALQNIKTDLLDKLNIVDGVTVGNYTSFFNPPRLTAEEAEDIGNYQKYHGYMAHDISHFYETFTDGVRRHGVDPSMYGAGDKNYNPDAFFRNIFRHQLAIFASENKDVYNNINTDPEAYRNFVNSIKHQLYEAGYMYGMEFKKYHDIYNSQNGRQDADELVQHQKTLGTLMNLNANLKFGNIANSMKATLAAEEARKSGKAVPQEGDDVIYGDWRSFEPPTYGDWRDAIYMAARRTGLDPELISAIIQQESGGNPTAKSSANAYGLMQLRASAEIDANKALGEAPNTYSRFNPEQNVFLGAAYMKQMLSGSSDLVDAMMRYNWGIGNFKKWKIANGPISAIPKEAREYPGRVLRYYGAHKFTDPKMPVNRFIHVDQRNKALAQAGLNGAINAAPTTEGSSGVSQGVTMGSDNSSDRMRASKYLIFSGTNLDRFMMVNPKMRGPFLDYAEEMFKTYNRRVMVTSTYRSIADQTRLWNNRANNPNTVGRPNQYNKHHLGLAIDINSRDGYSINDPLLNKYGMVRPLGKKDPVHVEMRQWANIKGQNLVNMFGDYPRNVGATNPPDKTGVPSDVSYSGSGTATASTSSSGSYATPAETARSSMSNTLSGLIAQKLQNYGVDINNSDGFVNAMALMNLAGDDAYYGDAEPVNFTGLTAGLRNTTFENELSKIKLASISNAQIRKIVNGNNDPLESQLTQVMALLAKKTAENNELMKQMVATNTTNVISVSNSNTTNSANSISNGSGGASSRENSNLDNSAMIAGNDMGLRALYI